MNVCKVIVVFLFSAIAAHGVEQNAADPPIPRVNYVGLLFKVGHLHDKITELESGIQKDRENTEQKFNGVLVQLNQTIDDMLHRALSMMNHSVSKVVLAVQSHSNHQETIDHNLDTITGRIDQLSERMEHSLTTQTTQSDVAMRKVEETIGLKLAEVHEVITTLHDQSNIALKKEREVTDLKLANITGVINELSCMTNQKLSEVISQLSQKVDQKLSGLVDTLSHNISALHGKPKMEERLQTLFNSTIRTIQAQIERKFNETTTAFQEFAEKAMFMIITMQNEAKEDLYKHVIWANHEQMRKEIETVKSNEDFTRLKKQSLRHLQHIALKSCWDNPSKQHGKYILKIGETEDIFLGQCAPTENGENSLEIQYRRDGSVNFTRSWKDYRDGFGNYEDDQWIGLERLHKLTTARPHELHVYLKDFEGNERYAVYSEFVIGSEAEQYALKKLGSYSGDAGDALSYHLGMKFSTYDRDNDLSKSNCASMWKGGWWYKDCYESNLNGLLVEGNDWKNIVWKQFNLSNKKMGLAFSSMYILETQHKLEFPI